MSVQFFWLPQVPWYQVQYSPRRSLTEVPCFDKNNLRDSPNDLSSPSTLFDHLTRKPVPSGEILTFRTNDPIRRPLPCMKLLEMHWMLTRVLALSGEVHDPNSPLALEY